MPATEYLSHSLTRALFTKGGPAHLAQSAQLASGAASRASVSWPAPESASSFAPGSAPLPAALGAKRSFAYFDHAASTPVHPEVIESMLPYFTDCFANPTGAHRMARRSLRAIDEARDVLAEAVGAAATDVVFCGSGTEADNLAIFGATAAAGGGVVCSATEHHAVLRPVECLGGSVVACDPLGIIDLNELACVLNERTRLVSVMLVNNETGVITPLREVAEVVRRHAPSALLHTDAVQGLAWLDLAETTREADLISLSAHKFGGPKGVGALVVRGGGGGAGVGLRAQILGGGQEFGLRSGTQNVAGIVGMGKAVEVMLSQRPGALGRVRKLRDRLADGIRDLVPSVMETAVSPAPCLATGDFLASQAPIREEQCSPAAANSAPGIPAATVDRSAKVAGNCHVCFEGVESEALLFLLEREGIYASAASSCASGAEDPSHVLAAMGYSRNLASGSLRLSLGYGTTSSEVDRVLAYLPAAVAQLRQSSEPGAPCR